MTEKPKHHLAKHWYLIHIIGCPVCGRTTQWRERIYSSKQPKPIDLIERYDVNYMVYDHCQDDSYGYR